MCLRQPQLRIDLPGRTAAATTRPALAARAISPRARAGPSLDSDPDSDWRPTGRLLSPSDASEDGAERAGGLRGARGPSDIQSGRRRTQARGPRRGGSVRFIGGGGVPKPSSKICSFQDEYQQLRDES